MTEERNKVEKIEKIFDVDSEKTPGNSTLTGILTSGRVNNSVGTETSDMATSL